jgi:hypothetical protein
MLNGRIGKGMNCSLIVRQCVSVLVIALVLTWPCLNRWTSSSSSSVYCKTLAKDCRDFDAGEPAYFY